MYVLYMYIHYTSICNVCMYCIQQTINKVYIHTVCIVCINILYVCIYYVYALYVCMYAYSTYICMYVHNMHCMIHTVRYDTYWVHFYAYAYAYIILHKANMLCWCSYVRYIMYVCTYCMLYHHSSYIIHTGTVQTDITAIMYVHMYVCTHHT
jgi:hypothetical protein